jgi:hypothetical protein
MLAVVGRHPGLHQRRRLPVDGLALLRDPAGGLVVPRRHPPLGLGGHVAGALARLLGVRVVAEPLEQFFGGHQRPFLPLGDRAGHCGGQPAQAVRLGDEPVVVPAQRRQLIGLPVEHGGDVGQPQPELAQHEDVLQPQQPLPLVVAEPAVPGAGRAEQTDVVVVPEGPGADPGTTWAVVPACDRR